jgi:hypothetical protein
MALSVASTAQCPGIQNNRTVCPSDSRLSVLALSAAAMCDRCWQILYARIQRLLVLLLWLWTLVNSPELPAYTPTNVYRCLFLIFEQSFAKPLLLLLVHDSNSLPCKSVRSSTQLHECADFLLPLNLSRVSGLMRFSDASDSEFSSHFEKNTWKIATEILAMIRQAFGEESMSRTGKVQTHRNPKRREGEEQSQERAWTSFSLTSKELSTNNSSWEAKQPIPQTTVTFYSGCLKMWEHLTMKLGVRMTCCITTVQSRTSFLTRECLTESKATIVPYPAYFSVSPTENKTEIPPFWHNQVMEAGSQAVLNSLTEHDIQGAFINGRSARNCA